MTRATPIPPASPEILKAVPGAVALWKRYLDLDDQQADAMTAATAARGAFAALQGDPDSLAHDVNEAERASQRARLAVNAFDKPISRTRDELTRALREADVDAAPAIAAVLAAKDSVVRQAWETFTAVVANLQADWTALGHPYRSDYLTSGSLRTVAAWADKMPTGPAIEDAVRARAVAVSDGRRRIEEQERKLAEQRAAVSEEIRARMTAGLQRELAEAAREGVAA